MPDFISSFFFGLNHFCPLCPTSLANLHNNVDPRQAGHSALEPGGGGGEEEGAGGGRGGRGHPEEVPADLAGGVHLDDLDADLRDDLAAGADLGLRQPQPAPQTGVPQLVERPGHAALAGTRFGAFLTAPSA